MEICIPYNRTVSSGYTRGMILYRPEIVKQMNEVFKVIYNLRERGKEGERKRRGGRREGGKEGGIEGERGEREEGREREGERSRSRQRQRGRGRE